MSSVITDVVEIRSTISLFVFNFSILFFVTTFFQSFILNILKNSILIFLLTFLN